MLYGMVVAALGESFLSLVLGMYTYRLENIPLYIPIGHSIIFACTCYIVKEPVVQKHQSLIIQVLFPALIIYSFIWLFLFNDLTGFIFMLAGVWILYRYPIGRIFFFITFLVTLPAEYMGTLAHSWEYPSVWFGQFEWIPSASPPSGITLFYTLFDLGCLWCYKKFNRQSWNRMRSIQQNTS